MKRIVNWFTRWQVYFYIAAAVILFTACIATVSPNGLMLIPILLVVIALGYKTIRDIIRMFKDILDNEENNGAD